MSAFKNYLKTKISKEQVDQKEAKKLGHIIDFVKLNTRNLRSGRVINLGETPPQQPSKRADPRVTKKPLISKQNPALKQKSLSFEELNSFTEEDIVINPIPIQLPDSIIVRRIMAEPVPIDFSTADFNRMIPEFKGDSRSLPVFLKRCDTFHATFTEEGQQKFLNHIIFKLGGKAFIIFESKRYATWAALKKDLLEGIKVNKSASALQNELMTLVQGPDKSAKEFADLLKEKLKELSDILLTQYDNNDVIASFKLEHEKIAIRTFREGLRSPLKHRIINFEARTLDELVRKAVEEEPFVKVLKPSTEPELNTRREVEDFNNFNGNWYRKKIDYDNKRNFNYYNQSNAFSKRDWRNDSNMQHRIGYINNRMVDSRNWNRNQNGRNFSSGQRFHNDQRNNEEIKVCLRCHKRGHLSDKCYVKLGNDDENQPNAQQDMNAQMKRVSFLETPRFREPFTGTPTKRWTNNEK